MTVRLNLLLGLCIGLTWTFLTAPSIIELALVLAFFILVPVLLSLVATSNPKSVYRINILTAARWSFPFAAAGMLSLSMETGWLAASAAAVWLLFTMAAAGNGIFRLLNRGIGQPEEAVIDAGLAFLAVGGVWLVLARSGAAELMPYSSLTIDLTAIHYHYSAFVLPIFTGMFGRWLFGYNTQACEVLRRRRAFTILAAGLAGGSPLVALGILHGPPFDLITSGVYIVFIYWLCLWVLASVLRIGYAAGPLAGIASLILMTTMGVSTLYSLGMYFETAVVTMDGMLRWHGALNAFGFSVLGTLAWLIARPKPRYDEKAFPVSRVRTRGSTGDGNVRKRGREEHSEQGTGLIADWNLLKGDDFDSEKINTVIRDFYVHTEYYDLTAEISWKIELIGRAARFFTKGAGQIHLPLSGLEVLEGSILNVPDQEDRCRDLRAWIRSDSSTGEPVFNAFYSTHRTRETGYFNIGLPLHRGIITRILRPENKPGGGLGLTSRKKPEMSGDEGIYLTVGRMTIKLPLEETFELTHIGGNLNAVHEIALFGWSILRITCEITKEEADEEL
ncbi:YndJ family protein [Alteribacter lacisalsi]|nr:YndJ family protein [Alteribacter lacisalsi]